MMDAGDILALLREEEANYALQDNVEAARLSRYLRGLIARIEGHPVTDNPPAFDAIMPSLADLKRKFGA